MTPPVFQATYSDWKLVRTRKVVQIVLEVPVEYSDEAYEVLGGMPHAAEEIWVGVARLNTKVGFTVDGALRNPVTQATTPEDATRLQMATEECEDPQSQGMPASGTATPARVLTDSIKKMGRFRNDIRFQKWLEETYGSGYGDIDLPTWTKEKLYNIIGVKSLADIKPDTLAADRLDRLIWLYEAEDRV